MRIKTKHHTNISQESIPDLAITEWKRKQDHFQKVKEDKRQILLLYRDIFDTVPSVSFPLVVLKLEYYLFRMTTNKAKWDAMSDKVKRNYDAAMAFNTNQLSDNLRELVVIDIKETKMAKVAVKKVDTNDNGNDSHKVRNTAHEFKRSVGKTLKLGIVQTWAHVFEKEKKWTDEVISEFMHKEFPDRKNKTFDNVSRTRYDYNAGRLTKGVPPKTPAVQFGKQETTKKK